jgi:hypothetical protein
LCTDADVSPIAALVDTCEAELASLAAALRTLPVTETDSATT